MPGARELTALIFETFLETAYRALQGSGDLSYFEFRAIDGLAEIATLHDRAVVLSVHEGSSGSYQHLRTVCDTIAVRLGLPIELIPKEDIEHTLDIPCLSSCHRLIAGSLSPSMAVESPDLLIPSPIDRTSEEFKDQRR